VHKVSDVRQIEVHMAESYIKPGPSCLEIEIATEKVKKYKLPGSRIDSSRT
jgi:hypothetical protein